MIDSPPTQAARRGAGSAWTRALQLWFVSLQLVGIYLPAAALFAVTVGGWILLSAVFYVLRWSAPAYPDLFGAIVGSIFGQPAVAIAVLAVMIVASVVITRGAFRHEGWAHWAAIALIVVSTLPVVQIAVFFHELAVWIVALAYCAGCAAFVAAMTYSFVTHGPWGVPAR